MNLALARAATIDPTQRSAPRAPPPPRPPQGQGSGRTFARSAGGQIEGYDRSTRTPTPSWGNVFENRQPRCLCCGITDRLFGFRGQDQVRKHRVRREGPPPAARKAAWQIPQIFREVLAEIEAAHLQRTRGKSAGRSSTASWQAAPTSTFELLKF